MNTFRMIIVDDEPMIRKGLRSLLHRIAPQWVVLGEAANGQDALALISELKPDLVLTDISMPIMNGIEMYTSLLKRDNCPFVLALSGFTDYIYVRQILVLGAVDYLTKPVEEPILIEKLGVIEERILSNFHRKLEEDEQNQQLSEFWFHQMLNDHNYAPVVCEERLRRLGIPTEGLYFCAMAIYHNTQRLEASDRSSYLYFILKSCQELIGGAGKVIRAEDGLILVLHWSNDHQALESGVQQFRENLLGFTEQYTKLTIAIGSSQVFEQFRQLQLCWEHAKMEIRFQLMSDVDADAIQWMVALQQAQSSTITNMIAASFPSHQVDTWREQFIKCLTILGKFASLAGLPQYLIVDHNAMKLLSQNASTIPREQWIDTLRTLAEDMIKYGQESAEQQHDTPLTVRVKRYIHSNLNANLTLQTVADHVRMSPSYLSEVFREATGTNFIDYVIQQRMELAKQLIIEDKHKLYEIASMVGYQSSKHFTTLFKRVVGVLPSDYKRYVSSTD